MYIYIYSSEDKCKLSGTKNVSLENKNTRSCAVQISSFILLIQKCVQLSLKKCQKMKNQECMKGK